MVSVRYHHEAHCQSALWAHLTALEQIIRTNYAPGEVLDELIAGLEWLEHDVHNLTFIRADDGVSCDE